jgi:hypothetical protein
LFKNLLVGLKSAIVADRTELLRQIEERQERVEVLTREMVVLRNQNYRFRHIRSLEWDAALLNLEKYPEAHEALFFMRARLDDLAFDESENMSKYSSPASLALLMRTLPSDKLTGRLL